MDSNFYAARKFQASMRIPIFSLPRALASYMIHVYSELVGRRSSCSKWLEIFLEVALAISYIMAAWICIFLTSRILPNFCKKCLYVCSFQQPYVHGIKYKRVSQFLKFFQVERGACMWSSNLLVESTVKFGVLMAVPRNGARKSLRNPASCLVLTGVS